MASENQSKRARPVRRPDEAEELDDGAVVTRAADVARLAERLSSQPIVAFDTEFIRERTFFPQLGLIQVADREEAWLVDPLALSAGDLQPLIDVLTSPDILKVAHAVEQDQECLYHAFGILADPVLDTAIAAALTGRGDQIGLAALLDKLFGVRLPKGHTRTDWLKRPLPAVMAKYALADVAHLVEAGERLVEDLGARGRREWALRLSADFARKERYEPDADALARRLAAGKRLDARGYVVLKELVKWREKRVRKANLPRRWLADDPLLVKLATARPTKPEDLANFRGLGAKTLDNGGGEILRAIRRGLEIPAEELERPPTKPHSEAEENSAAAALRCFLGLMAARHEIPTRFLVDPDNLPLLLRRRFRTTEDLRRSGLVAEAAVDSFVDELHAVLAGRRALRLVNGRVEEYEP
jgi:ribonuclease D